MIESGWRTVCVESHAYLGYSEGNLVIRGEEELLVPLCQIREVLVLSREVSVSSCLLSALAEKGIAFVFCDSRLNPVGQITPLHGHTFCAGNLMKQAAWTETAKAKLWQQIVVRKIGMQADTLSLFGKDGRSELTVLQQQTLPADVTNSEGLAAKMYFHRLFGFSFVRGNADNINSALNYGYTVLLSAFNRLVCQYGYKTELGVHHCNVTNPYNLSCDLMEPFRPFVDTLVYGAVDRELDMSYKKELAAVLYGEALLDGKRYSLHDAAEIYVKQCLDCMNGQREIIGEIAYCDRQRRVVTVL